MIQTKELLMLAKMRQFRVVALAILICLAFALAAEFGEGAVPDTLVGGKLALGAGEEFGRRGWR